MRVDRIRARQRPAAHICERSGWLATAGALATLAGGKLISVSNLAYDQTGESVYRLYGSVGATSVVMGVSTVWGVFTNPRRGLQDGDVLTAGAQVALGVVCLWRAADVNDRLCS